MPDLTAPKHIYTLDAIARQRRETLDMPTGDIGYILINGGADDGDNLLTEDAELLTHDGSVLTVLTYKLSAHRHRYILDALKQTKIEPHDTGSVTVRQVPPATATVTPADPAFVDHGAGYPWGFEWAYWTSVPLKTFTATGYAPTTVVTFDDLLCENSDFLVQETGDNILVDI